MKYLVWSGMDNEGKLIGATIIEHGTGAEAVDTWLEKSNLKGTEGVLVSCCELQSAVMDFGTEVVVKRRHYDKSY